MKGKLKWSNIKDQRNKNLVLWKDKQNWQTLTQTNEKKEMRKIHNIRDEESDIKIDTTEIQNFITESF
jgi:beta-xylosidase